MHSVLRLALLALVVVGMKADVLQLRDGSTYTGRYLGGTQTEIWFQRQGAAEADSVPTEMVEGLKFGTLPGIILPGAPGQIDPVARPAAASLLRKGEACRPSFSFQPASVLSRI